MDGSNGHGTVSKRLSKAQQICNGGGRECKGQEASLQADGEDRRLHGSVGRVGGTYLFRMFATRQRSRTVDILPIKIGRFFPQAARAAAMDGLTVPRKRDHARSRMLTDALWSRSCATPQAHRHRRSESVSFWLIAPHWLHLFDEG